LIEVTHVNDLTLREAAAEYRVSTDTLRRRIKAGVLPHRRKLGRIVLRRADVEAVVFGAEAAAATASAQESTT
jgi:hypothetical protein